MSVQSVSTLNRWLTAILVAASVLSLAAVAADTPAGKSQTPPTKAQMDEMMAAWEKMATPGPQHAELMKNAGSWNAVIKSWMSPGDPVVTKGSANYKPILGGRFLMEEYKGIMMDKPFEGFGITGYDNTKKEYTNVWMDSMGTMMIFARGTMDASGKVLTMTSQWEDPVTGEVAAMRMVTTFVDASTKKFEMYGTHGGQEAKEMEITYTRAK
ncbi:MAG: DUF1579 domain-containing protein [Acidobacteria bacterium]|nr:DUF1579 domain-containing protein [Acidobacteriota bacterium]